MRSHSNRASRRYSGLVVAALIGATPFVVSAAAWAESDGGDVALDHVTITSKAGDTFVIPHVDFTNTNLTKDEINALLSPDTPEADGRTLAMKLKADKISVPSIEVTAKDGTTIKLHGVTASDVDAGRVGKFGLSGLDGSGTSDGSQVSIKSAALLVEGLDVRDVLKAVGGSGEGAQTGRMDHLIWNTIDITTSDPRGGSAKTDHIAVGSVELHGGYSGGALRGGWSKITGVVIEPAANSAGAQSLASLGYSRLELAMGVSANYEADAKTLSLDNLTVDGVQMGSLALKANFIDVAPGLFHGATDSRLQALFGCGVVSLELRLVNAGLFEKALAFYAKQEHSTPEALKQQWSDAVGQMAPLFLGGTPAALKAAAEAQKFIVSPHNLTVAIKAKEGALKAADFIAISDPVAFAGKLDIAAAANQ
jgi:hypothetical protein